MWSGTEARNDIIKAVRTSMAYMHKKALAPLHELPFSATQGDVRKRVDEIAAMPQPPAGTLGTKLHVCCRFFRDEAIAALELLREAPFFRPVGRERPQCRRLRTTSPQLSRQRTLGGSGLLK